LEYPIIKIIRLENVYKARYKAFFTYLNCQTLSEKNYNFEDTLTYFSVLIDLE